VSEEWHIEYRPAAELPALAWIARVGFPNVVVACGNSLRRTADAFVDGTWAGADEVASIAESTTVFGAGIVARGDALLVVPASHTCEGIYLCRSDGRGGDLLVSNSLAALLEAAGLELVAGVDYVSRFIKLAEGIDFSPIEIPTSGRPVEFHFFEHLRIEPDRSLAPVCRPREAPFRSFQDYVARLDAALGSLLANARGYQPAIALSNGYDSTAMAVIAARHGVRRALTFGQSRPALTTGATSDSGERTAERLGMTAVILDRLTYSGRADLPEAEFLATGGPGEDVANAAMEAELRHGLLITGDVGAALWRYGRPRRSDLWRLDLSGSSMTEFRLRLDMLFVPLPVFGMTEIPSLQDITLSEEMQPWSVGGYYDRPIARRIAEEGGLPRGSFATVKNAASALIHQDPRGRMAPASVGAVERFAADEGTPLEWVARAPLRKRERFVIKAAHRLHVEPLARGLAARQWAMIHHEPRQGSLLFRWGVSVVRPRYRRVRALLAPEPGAG